MDDMAYTGPAPLATGSPSIDALPSVPPAPTPRSGGAAVRRVGWRTGIALGMLAFLAGLAVMALVAGRFAASFGGAKQVATLTVPVGPGGQAPVVIVPGRAAATGAAATGPAIDLAALSARETALDAQIAQLEARTATTDQSSTRASAYATRAEGLMIAFAARRALDRGLNLGFLEGQLRTRFGATQPRAVATIVQAAHEPVTLEDLRAGLDGVAPELMTGAASTGWWTSLRREIGNLVVLRRAGTPSSLPLDRVERARRLLAAGQVEAALSEVAHTPGAPRAEGWTAAARRYIGARTALDTIESTALRGAESAPEPVAPAQSAPTPEAAPEATGAVGARADRL